MLTTHQRFLFLLVGVMLTLGDAAWGAPAEPGASTRPRTPLQCVSCHDRDYSTSGHNPSVRPDCTFCHAVPNPAATIESLAPGHPVTTPTDVGDCRACHEAASRAGHPEVASGRCLTCHDPHENRARKTPSWPQREAADCVQCHEPKDRELHTHTIVRRGECSGCHDVHGPVVAQFLVGGTNTAACATCHPDQAVPGPDETWALGPDKCDSCHDPHGSANPGQLVKPEAELCATCHEPLSPGLHPHGAVRLGQCSTCHDPHGARHALDLGRIDEGAAACYGCHADDVSARQVLHAPVAEEDCAACHDAHGSDYPAGLVAEPDVLCLSCHEEQDRREAAHPHMALSASCSTCHDPHGSKDPLLLPSGVNDLCIACHPAFTDGTHVSTSGAGGTHPIGPNPKRPRKGTDELSCASCHDAHGSDNTNLFYRASTNAELCRECHGAEFGSAPRRGTPRPAAKSTGTSTAPLGAQPVKSAPKVEER